MKRYAIVALKYRSDAEQAHFATLKHGDPLTLRRAPTNKFDKNAVEVCSGEYVIGYIPGTQNKPLALAMDSVPKDAPLPHGKLDLAKSTPIIEVED